MDQQTGQKTETARQSQRSQRLFVPVRPADRCGPHDTAMLRLQRSPWLRWLLPDRCWAIPEAGLTIGSGAQNGLRVRAWLPGGKSVRRVHAWVYGKPESNAWYVESLGGVVHVDDKLVFGRTRLHDGVCVRMGAFPLVFSSVRGGR